MREAHFEVGLAEYKLGNNWTLERSIYNGLGICQGSTRGRRGS